jgi:hypothetical protein
MPQQTTTTNHGAPGGQIPTDPKEYRKMVERVADKVWEIWREELRRERERRGNEVR